MDGMVSKEKGRLAFIDNSIDSSVYNPEEHWKPYLEVEWDSFKATKHQFPDFKKVKYTHLLLTGSEASIVTRDKWAEEEAEVIQEAVERGLAVLGSCYGHQLLAYALLGSSSVRRSPRPEVGWIPVQIVRESRILGKKRQAFSFSVHFDEVVNLNEDFHILASTERCLVQAFQVKDRPIWGFQIHPEINIQNARTLLKNLIALKLNNTSIFEKALNSRPKDSGLIKQITECFLSAGGYR
ncbi:MAG: gamma-glutamyl-gamma-aminobutyrate hydrolase family protein [Candidatus Aminicenantes bacterium]|nr:gamma-glutamyl-gamma-aminobutyrate hydrolase family protein [Candidatus Aminicenantes bacterium]